MKLIYGSLSGLLVEVQERGKGDSAQCDAPCATRRRGAFDAHAVPPRS